MQGSLQQATDTQGVPERGSGVEQQWCVQQARSLKEVMHAAQHKKQHPQPETMSVATPVSRAALRGVLHRCSCWPVQGQGCTSSMPFMAAVAADHPLLMCAVDPHPPVMSKCSDAYRWNSTGLGCPGPCCPLPLPPLPLPPRPRLRPPRPPPVILS